MRRLGYVVSVLYLALAGTASAADDLWPYPKPVEGATKQFETFVPPGESSDAPEFRPAGLGDNHGHMLMDLRYRGPVALNDHIIAATDSKTNRAVLYDIDKHRVVAQTDYVIAGHAINEQDRADLRFTWLARPVAGSPVDFDDLPTDYEGVLINDKGEILATLPPFKKGMATNPSSFATFKHYQTLAGNFISAGNVMVFNYRAPDGTPLSRLYTADGKVAGPDVPQGLMVVNANDSGAYGTGREFAMQGIPLPAGYGAGYDMAFRPVDADGRLLPLPAGAIGMFPAVAGGINADYRADPKDATRRIYDARVAPGWVVVFADGHGLSFAPGIGTANEVAAKAATLLRYDKVAESSNTFLGYSNTTQQWTVFDGQNLTPVYQGRGAPDDVAYAWRVTENQRYNAAIKEKYEADMAAYNASEKAAADRAAADAQAQQAHRDAWVQDYQKKAAAHDVSGALQSAWTAGCDVYAQAYATFGAQGQLDLNRARQCGLSEADIAAHGGAVYVQDQKDRSRANFWNGLNQGLDAWTAGLNRQAQTGRANDPDVVVQVYTNGGVTSQVMRQSAYNRYYNPQTR